MSAERLKDRVQNEEDEIRDPLWEIAHSTNA